MSVVMSETRPSVHLTSLVFKQNPALRRLAGLAETDPPRFCKLTDRLGEADIVLFVENGYFGLSSIRNFYVTRNENRHAQYYFFSEGDWPFPFLPGLYCSLSRRLPWAFSWAFLLDATQPYSCGERDASYLFSFLGRLRTHPVRRRICRLDSASTPCVDVAHGPQRFDCWDYQTTYLRLVSESLFVLCPRGFGTSSIRIFETMRAGRVPVIISDAWIEPPVGEWSQFSLRVPEHAVEQIPQICEQHLDAAVAMGALARRAFDEFFSPTRFLDSAILFLRTAAGAVPGVWSRSPVRNAARALSVREFREIAHRARHGLISNCFRFAR